MGNERLKFAIWRHENSIGNSAEQVIALAKYLKEKDIKKPEIYVEKQFQKDFVLCIPDIEEEDVFFFPQGVIQDQETLKRYVETSNKNLHIPNCYTGFKNQYPGTWSYIGSGDGLNVTLEFDEKNYENKFNLPKDAIVVFYRERGTWNKRGDGDAFENHRFVQVAPFFNLIYHFADKGHKVVKIGDRNQLPIPGTYLPSSNGMIIQTDNIIDFTKYVDSFGRPMWTMKDYLFLFKYCKLFISCDAGVWPMVAGLRKNLVFCNVTSCYRTTPNFIYRKGKDTNGETVYEAIDWVYKHDGLHEPGEDITNSPDGTFPYEPEKKYYKVNYSQIYSWMPKETTRVLKKEWTLYDSKESFPEDQGAAGFQIPGPAPNTNVWASLLDTPTEDIIKAAEDFL